jgi:hypothetical protein
MKASISSRRYQVLIVLALLFLTVFRPLSSYARNNVSQRDDSSLSGEGKPTDWDSPKMTYELSRGSYQLTQIKPESQRSIVYVESHRRLQGLIETFLRVAAALLPWWMQR